MVYIVLNMPYSLFMDNYMVNLTDSPSKPYKLPRCITLLLSLFILLLSVKQNAQRYNRDVIFHM